jgi:DNA-binding NtrC family response regulator
MTPFASQGFRREQKALLVHPELKTLSDLQSELAQKGYTTVIARDLPTALMALTQHYFDIGLIAARVSEEGDGWSLSGVFHMVFPKSFVAVLGAEASVRTLQTAINNGINEVYPPARTPQEIVTSVVQSLPGMTATRTSPPPRRVQ